MDLTKIPVFAAIGKRMEWLNQRQKVLAENVANANTPNFRPSDLAPQTFRDLVAGSSGKRVAMAGTSAGHIAGRPAPAAGLVKGKATDVSPSGNAVVIEEELMKVSETQANYALMTNLYRKHIGMLKTALGRHNG
jgi:flagellar basal-body rod protein FlgB